VKVEVAGKAFEVKVKVAKDTSGRVLSVKPEFEDAKKIASETGVPLREVIEKVKKRAKEL